jgi:hypothetical protein
VLLASALSASALVWPSPLWAGIVLTATIAILSLATLGSVRRRAFCIGFAVAAWLYLALVATRLTGDRQESLVTTRATLALHRICNPSAGPPPLAERLDPTAALGLGRRVRITSLAAERLVVLSDQAASDRLVVTTAPLMGDYYDGRVYIARSATPIARTTLGSLLVVGHSLWTIVLGLLGGAAAVLIGRIDRHLTTRNPGR